MSLHQDLEKLFKKHGFENFKWIDPGKIVVAQWVRMKCMFGCNGYGHCGSCPPNVPPMTECERFFREYKEAVVFHFEKELDHPEDRHAWGKKVNQNLLKLERELFISGCRKAFLLFMDSCGLCKECSGTREACKNQADSRPSPEGMGVDVFATVKQFGYPIDVLSGYKQKMNRYAFIMIE